MGVGSPHYLPVPTHTRYPIHHTLVTYKSYAAVTPSCGVWAYFVLYKKKALLSKDEITYRFEKACLLWQRLQYYYSTYIVLYFKSFLSIIIIIIIIYHHKFSHIICQTSLLVVELFMLP